MNDEEMTFLFQQVAEHVGAELHKNLRDLDGHELRIAAKGYADGWTYSACIKVSGSELWIDGYDYDLNDPDFMDKVLAQSRETNWFKHPDTSINSKRAMRTNPTLRAMIERHEAKLRTALQPTGV